MFIKLSFGRNENVESVGELPPVDNRDALYETYLADRSAKIALGEKQSEFIDKWLLTLSGGALGLALTFLHDRGPVKAGSWTWTAYAGVACLVLSIFLVLLSLLMSQLSIDQHIKAADTVQSGDSSLEQNRVLQDSWWAKATGWLNWFAAGAFISGISCMAIFITNNLDIQKEEPKVTTTGSSTGNSKPIERGAVITPPPTSRPTPTPTQSTPTTGQGGSKK